MPFTFSAGSFPFLKGLTTFQPNIKQNNNVDNVNKNNNNVKDNLDMGTNRLVYLSPNNNVNVIPLERRTHSLETSKNGNRNSNSGNPKNINRKGWYRSLFGRIHNTILKRNDDDDDDDDDDDNNNNNGHNTFGGNNGLKDLFVEPGNLDACDDDPIIMKSRNPVAKNSFIHRGNTHDFYIITKGASLKNGSLTNGSSTSGSLTSGSLTSGSLTSGSLTSGSFTSGSLTSDSLTSGSLTSGSLTDDTLKPSHSSPNLSGDNTSFLEKCAKTPRHFAKEPEVLGKVGRFTVLREREDFDTTYFDQCHCLQKPCRFSTNGCSGTHPVLPPELFKENDYYSSFRLSQQAAIIAYQQAQMQMACSNKHNSSCSLASSKSRSIYTNNTNSDSSRNSSSSLQRYNNININNGAYSSSVMGSKATYSTVPTFPNSNPIPVVLTHSSSSPNLVHLNHRSKIESVQNKNISKNNKGRPNSNIIVGGNSGKHPNPPTNNPQHNNNTTVKKHKFSLVNSNEQQRSLSMPPIHAKTTPALNIRNSSSTPTTPTIQSKFSISHTGRKFEVEWNTSARNSSSSSPSSISSSDTAYSPPFTISSMASSPDQKSTINTLNRRYSKCGRKFEIFSCSSPSNNNNSLLNTSPHSTMDSVSSVISSITDVNTEPTKC